MNLFGMLEISGSAMTAERERAQIVTSNMANAQTTRFAGFHDVGARVKRVGAAGFLAATPTPRS